MWILVNDKLPSESGIYEVEVLASPFDNDKTPSIEFIHYNADDCEWDTANHMPVYKWKENS